MSITNLFSEVQKLAWFVSLPNNSITIMSDYLTVIYLPINICIQLKYADLLNYFLLVLKILPVGAYFIFIDRKRNFNTSICTYWYKRHVAIKLPGSQTFWWCQIDLVQGATLIFPP